MRCAVIPESSDLDVAASCKILGNHFSSELCNSHEGDARDGEEARHVDVALLEVGAAVGPGNNCDGCKGEEYG